MTSSTLLGNNFVSEEEVFSVPAVPYTRTFHPVHHKELISVLSDSIAAVGLDVVKKEYVLAAEGRRMFSVWDLNQGSSELCWSIGIRNSMDRSMSLGITAGTKVFVCQNLCFSGEYISMRRHTSGLTIDELAFLAFRAVRSLIPQLKQFQRWHESLRNFPLSNIEMNVLLVEILSESVIPASKFHKFCDLYANVYKCEDLWSFHESATDVLKGSNVLTLPKKNLLLNGVINRYIDTFEDCSHSTLGDFFEERASR